MTGHYRDYGYATPEHGSGAAGHALVRKFVSVVSQLENVSAVCDLGCGNGFMASQLGKEGFRVTGIDASITGIEMAQRYYETANVTFVKGDFDSSDEPLSTLPNAP